MKSRLEGGSHALDARIGGFCRGNTCRNFCYTNNRLTATKARRTHAESFRNLCDRNTFLEITLADKDHPVGFSHAGILVDDLESTVTALQKEGLKMEDVHLGGTKARMGQ
jgi:hypothetical protein